MTKLIVAFFMLLGLWAATPAETAAQTRIKILVNGQPITTYDIQQRARLLRLIEGVPGSAATRAAEEELIDNVLQAFEARRIGVNISQSEIDRAYASIAQRNGFPVSQLDQILRAQGVNPDAFKRRIGAQMRWTDVVRQKTRRTNSLSEQDVIAALRDSDEEIDDTTVEYTLTQVILVVPSNGPNSNPQNRTRQAEQLRTRFRGCAEGLALAQELGEVVIKQVGVRTSAELQGASGEAIMETPVGQLTRPQPGRNSIEMFAVCDKKEIRSTAAAQARLALEMEEEVTEIELRRFARDLRKTAIIEYK